MSAEKGTSVRPWKWAGGAYENNDKKDFHQAVHYGLTEEEYAELAAERRHEAEDLERARALVNAERWEADGRREGAAAGVLQKDGRVIVKTAGPLTPGSTATLLFNKVGWVYTAAAA